jgi:hypothetical protein
MLPKENKVPGSDLQLELLHHLSQLVVRRQGPPVGLRALLQDDQCLLEPALGHQPTRALRDEPDKEFIIIQ